MLDSSIVPFFPQADYEFISSGLYLVVLLHLCEQRFSDMLGTTSEANTRVRVSGVSCFFGSGKKPVAPIKQGSLFSKFTLIRFRRVTSTLEFLFGYYACSCGVWRASSVRLGRTHHLPCSLILTYTWSKRVGVRKFHFYIHR